MSGLQGILGSAKPALTEVDLTVTEPVKEMNHYRGYVQQNQQEMQTACISTAACH